MQPLLDSEILEGFRQEVESRLPEIRNALQQAAADPSGAGRLTEACRLAHNIKGAAGMIGLEQLSREAGALESRLQEAIEEAWDPAETLGFVQAVDALEATVRDAFADAVEPIGRPPERPKPAPAFDPGECWREGREDVPADLQPTFREEAEELLSTMHDALGILRGDPSDAASLEALRRHVHTLKGAAGMVGLHNASKLAHRMEDGLDRFLSGDAGLSGEAGDVLQAGLDALEDLSVPGARSAELRKRTLALHQEIAGLAESPLEQLANAILTRGPRNESPETSSELKNDAAAPSFRAPLERIDELLRLSSEMTVARSALRDRQTALAQECSSLQAAAGRLQRLAERLQNEVARAPWRPGVARRQARPPDEKSAPTPVSAGFDELELDRYTELSLLSGNLTDLSAEISAGGARMGGVVGDARHALRRLGELAGQSQDRLMQLRMAPLSSLRRRLERTVRVAAAACGKEAVFEMEGDVELDKSVLDALVGPLEHLLRNAVDHGLEPAARRAELGKPGPGLIRLTARLDGTQAALELSDDGAGFDLEALRERVVAAGLLDAQAADAASARELHRFAFRAGLTTAREISEISGRGVGLDAVRSAILALGGSIIVDSEQGRGSVFSIRAPATLATARALLVHAAEQAFAMPLYAVTRVLRARREDLRLEAGRPILRDAAGNLPVVHLNESLGLRMAEPSETFPVLIVDAGERRYALAVERLGETRDIVIKSLGPLLQGIRGVSGATVLGDGKVCLTLNPAELLHDVTTPAAQPESRSARPLRILVVDDSPSVRRVAARVIESQGWEATTARDGLDALETLQSAESTPDALLLDIEMPRLDGFELTAALRGSAEHQELPIVMLTSRAGEKHRRKAFELGADDYLVKPFEAAALLAALEKAARKQKEGD